MRVPPRILLLASITLAAGSLCGAAYVRHDDLGRFAWQRFHFAYAATFFSPSNAALHEEMGNYYFSTAHYDIKAARSHFERAVALNPAVPLSHYQLGRINFIEGRHARALYELNAQLALDPQFMRAYYMLGLVHAYSGDTQAAARDFKAFLAWKPTSWAANNDLAWVYFTDGQYAKALAQADNGLQYNEGNVWLLTMRGVALLNLGRKAEAKVSLTSALAGVQKMTAADWSTAYPGNDPSIAEEGLREMKQAIEKNLALVQ
jgi:tetratricopeptide (TPR) repeat protein